MKKTTEKTKEEETRVISKEEDEHYMRMALAEAEKAFAGGEVPVGAVLVHKNNNSSSWRARTTRRKRKTTHSRTRNWNASRVGEKR
jgi:tRNA(adenine34) deaminase